MDLITPTDDQNVAITATVASHELRSIIISEDAGSIFIQARDQTYTLYEGTGADVETALADLETKF